jgi:hypothetical protein
MLQKMMILLTPFLIFPLNSFAQEEIQLSSLRNCSNIDARACATLQLSRTPSTQGDNAFVLSFQGTGADLQITKLDLWMDMGSGQGHGSSPVSIVSFGNGRYQVRDVYFVMKGPWWVRVGFISNHRSHQITFPIQVSQ